jgi:hypothetical protein
MFKKPFKGPEYRICRACNEQFWAEKPVLRCKPCVNKEAQAFRDKKREEAILNGTHTGKQGRSLDIEGKNYLERRKDFVERVKFLDKMQDRTQWQEFYKEEFDRIVSDKVLWKALTREGLGKMVTKNKDDENSVMGRPSHKLKQWPTWEEFEAGGWGGIEDS